MTGIMLQKVPSVFHVALCPLPRLTRVLRSTPGTEQEPPQYGSSGPFRSLGNSRPTGVLGVISVTATPAEFAPQAGFVSFAFY